METDTSLEILEQLDFQFSPPCEHSQHSVMHKDEPAMFVVSVKKDNCPCSDITLFLCLSGWELYGRVGFTFCTNCGTRYNPKKSRDESYTIIKVIGTN